MNHIQTIRVARTWVPLVLVCALIGLSFAACGDNDEGEPVVWIEGTPPPDVLAEAGLPVPEGQTSAVTPVATTESTEGTDSAVSGPTPTPNPPTPTATTAIDAPTGERLTEEQLVQYLPNELGLIPILEYHSIVADEAEEAQFARTIDDFRADLQWLLDHDFYVVPLADIIQNNIAAPAGKRPVAITFDDSYANQFRYLIEDDGSLTIDPSSGVGIMEAFYQDHPEFGRGGFFAVIPGFCFDWTATTAEPDQTAFCGQKISWLLDNGYEIGNHTLNHQSLYDVDDETFKSEIAGAIDALKVYDPRVEANIIAMTFGDYPDLETRGHQRDWLRDGFEWEGRSYQMIGALMVGANPAYSPISTEWDQIYIARIQAFDEDAGVDADGLDVWFSIFEEYPERMYVSDGNIDTNTVPEDLPVAIDGTLNMDRIEADGKELIRY